jgi:formylglycine-generating enzyme required for sulfatase activity
VSRVALVIGLVQVVAACVAVAILLKVRGEHAKVDAPAEVRPPDIPGGGAAAIAPAPVAVKPAEVPPAVTRRRPELLDCTGPTGASAAEVGRLRAAWANYLGVRPEETIVVGNGMAKLVLLPPGKFYMGSPDGEKAREANEVRHEVTLSEPFYLGGRTVTRAEFRRFVEETGYATDAESDHQGGNRLDTASGGWRKDPALSWRSPSFEQADDHPVVMVSWNDATKYAEWLGSKDGRKYRLPTEAEWEYACRAGTRTPFFFGDDGSDMIRFGNAADASFRRETRRKWGIQADDGYAFTAPAGHFQPNRFGLYDMHGNVWQWCADRTGDYPQTRVTDPVGPSGDGVRVLRGGSWYSDPPIARAAHRYGYAQNGRLCDAGFRLALDAPAGK